MKKILQRLQPYRFPLLSLAILVLAFGLQTPWLGFYWDDWALAWFSHQFGAQYFIGYEPFRPVSGWLYSLSFSLLHESTFAWQLYALLWRWACVLAFWWLLRLLWRRAGRLPELAALIFALYPGFSQQPIAVTYSLYWMYYTFFLVSLGLMVLAVRSKEYRLWLTLGAMTLSLLTMFSTEYFYGLELLRPLLIWIVIGGQELATRRRIRQSLRAWAPYLPIVIIVFAWRYALANAPGNLYSTSLLTEFLARPLATLIALAGTVLGDFFEAGLAAWARLGDAITQLSFSSKVTWIYVAVVLAAAWLAAAILLRREDAKFEKWREKVGLGASALLVGGLSFWVAELPLRLTFAWDRFTLPMLFGVAILLGTAIEILRVQSRAKIIFLCVLLGLAAGYHFFNANAYREEWESQRNFFKQLIWRAPGIEANTALLSVEPPLEHYTDNSLTAPLIWIYNRDAVANTIPYYMAYLDLRADAELLGGGSGTIDKVYRSVHFAGNSADVLVFYYAPPACLRILDPELDPLFPKLPEILAQQAPRSNLARIGAQPDRAVAEFPFWSSAPDNSWCYYFEKADLARQLGDWEQVAKLGDIAFSLDDAPNHPAERTPFIEGYAHVGNWKRATVLTQDALEINPLMQPMLCKLWERITVQTSESAEREVTLAQIHSLLACSNG